MRPRGATPLQPFATPLSPSTTCLFVHYAFTGQCRGSKRSSRSSVHFFSHFLFLFSSLLVFERIFLARCIPLSFTSTLYASACSVPLFTQLQTKSYNLLCVFGSALLQNLSRSAFVSTQRKAACTERSGYAFTVRGAAVNRNYFNGERYSRSGLGTK